MKCKSPGKMVRTMILHFLKSNIKNKLFLFGELGCLSSFTNMLFSLFWFPYIQDREGDSCSPQQRYLKNTGLLGSSRTEVKQQRRENSELEVGYYQETLYIYLQIKVPWEVGNVLSLHYSSVLPPRSRFGVHLTGKWWGCPGDFQKLLTTSPASSQSTVTNDEVPSCCPQMLWVLWTFPGVSPTLPPPDCPEIHWLAHGEKALRES